MKHFQAKDNDLPENFGLLKNFDLPENFDLADNFNSSFKCDFIAASCVSKSNFNSKSNFLERLLTWKETPLFSLFFVHLKYYFLCFLANPAAQITVSSKAN
jgi:hypothetical protein